MATHTPGQWEWIGRDFESNCPGHYEAVIESTVSCGSFCYGGTVDMKISDADRRLIAAAPELPEALEKIASETAATWVQAVANAAIAKATGTA
jgi:hypothetical protein